MYLQSSCEIVALDFFLRSNVKNIQKKIVRATFRSYFQSTEGGRYIMQGTATSSDNLIVDTGKMRNEMRMKTNERFTNFFK